MNNSFGLEDDQYDLYRRAGLDALCLHYPRPTLLVLGWAVTESEKMGLGNRLEAIAALSRAGQAPFALIGIRLPKPLLQHDIGSTVGLQHRTDEKVIPSTLCRRKQGPILPTALLLEQ